MAIEHFSTPTEFKFVGDATPGEFEGYGAVFGNTDWHGDMIVPGAFAASLAQHKAAGTMPAMFVAHGLLGGDSGLPVGVWQDVREDSRGLVTKGRLSGMDTDRGRYLRSLMQDGAMAGQSIGFKTMPGGAARGQRPTDPKRTLSAVHLIEVSIVRDPSNPLARTTHTKAAGAMHEPDHAAAAGSIAAAMKLHDAGMTSSYSDQSPRDKAHLMNHLRDAHHALTGERAPSGMDSWKAIPTASEIKAALVLAGMDEEEAERIAAAGARAHPEPEMRSNLSTAAAELRALIQKGS